jgi:DNA repair exonuclease SbcCD ATPase subunit
VLGISASSFLSCVMLSQTQPMFLDLKPDAKAAAFSEVLGLDVWLSYAKRAGEKASEQDKRVRAAESALARAEGALHELVSDGLQSSREEWDSMRERDLARMEGEFDHALAAIDAAKMTTAGEALRTHDVEEARRQATLEQIRTNLEAFRAGPFQDAKTAAALAKDNLRRAAEELKACDGMGTVCTECGQEITGVLRADHIAAAERELTLAQRKLKAADNVLLGVDEGVHGIEVQYDRVRAELRALSSRRGALERANDESRRMLSRAEAEADRIESAFKVRQTEVNPFLALEEAAQKARDTAQKALTDARADLSRSQERYALLSLWVRGFKDVRLELIGEGLSQLEIEVNNNLGRLGLGAWRIAFDVDRETASGGLKKGFAVTVQSPANAQPVPWEAWSGGESQRLRLAGSMGLADVTRSVRGVGLNLEVWDEPTTWLSPQGVADLLQCLEARAVREGRQIWIVDHRSLSFGAFTGSVTIRKTSSGSVIEQEF